MFEYFNPLNPVFFIVSTTVGIRSNRDRDIY